ncbi:MAG TPA: cyclic nucleotide-binding domain-containing protein [Streptosporangiaceae bacterium]|nr:cyclic nucleotide-binding domain-containing protein [Streptosporangiaceae bacterium]
MEDVAAFLGAHPPFDEIGATELDRVAAVTQEESSPRGTAIFAQGAGPVEAVWMVRSGSVEVVHDGRVLDLLGPGELFGQASMISGLPFRAVASVQANLSAELSLGVRWG